MKHTDKVSALMKALTNLTEEQKAEFASRALITNVNGHELSRNNKILLYLQAGDTFTPTVIGGYNQWLKAGKRVQKGQHGMMIWIPKLNKPEETQAEAGEDMDAGMVEEAPNTQIPRRFFTATVFDISQVEDKDPVVV